MSDPDDDNEEVQEKGWNADHFCGFDVSTQTVVNDNIWRQMDFERVCRAGGELYVLENYKSFLCKIFGLMNPPSGVTVSLWRKNRRLVVNFQSGTTCAHIDVWKKTVHQGDCQGAASKIRNFPVIGEENKMELDLLCIFITDMVDGRRDPRGRSWFL